MGECDEPTQAAIGSEAAGPERPAEPPREPVAKPPARFQAINRQQCCPGTPSRTLVHTENLPAVAAYIVRMQTDAAREAYRLRAPVAEFTNAWLKAKPGLRQFCIRGLEKVRCEVLWECLTYNIQQWFRLRWKLRLAAVA